MIQVLTHSLIDALTGVLDPSAPRLALRMGPTTSVVRQDVNVAEERRGVVLLDTPGLPLPDAGGTRTRAQRALIAIVEDRLSRVLAEESKVVRRKSDGGELVHLSESERGSVSCHLCQLAPPASPLLSLFLFPPFSS